MSSFFKDTAMYMFSSGVETELTKLDIYDLDIINAELEIKAIAF